MKIISRPKKYKNGWRFEHEKAYLHAKGSMDNFLEWVEQIYSYCILPKKIF
jgi:hypothetical protein